MGKPFWLVNTPLLPSRAARINKREVDDQKEAIIDKYSI